ncbi:MAG TPA: VTT domain-containing protein [Candidatus Polarisedimenticolaceae bacterium]|nr:VTT domain-containing protein [Candidatus Polarisedimenticolaceae bacterium]
MASWLSPMLAGLAGNAVAQGVLAGMATLVLEDPAVIGCGLLVADGRMDFTTALVGLTAGIAGGDLGLFAAGRAFGPRVLRRGFVRSDRIDRAGAWLRRNLLVAVLLARWLPGMRLPTYLGAGACGASFGRFAVLVIGASAAWTTLLLSASSLLGEAVLPWLGSARLALAGVGVVAIAMQLVRWKRFAEAE